MRDGKNMLNLVCTTAVALTLCSGALLSCGCKRTTLQSPSPSYAAQIKELKSADVAGDVSHAIAAGDFRFVGVMGVGPIVPGAPDWVRMSAGRARYIPNTSDVIENAEQGRLQRVAYEYAQKYNKILLEKMPSLATTQPATEPAK